MGQKKAKKNYGCGRSQNKRESGNNRKIILKKFKL